MKRFRLFPHLNSLRIVGVAALFALGLAESNAAVPPITLRPVLAQGKVGFEWDAIANAYYIVQSSTSLGTGAVWVAREPVSTNSAGTVRWMAPEALDTSRFYRVALPQPDVFSLEPAIVSTTGGTAVYLLGQALGTNGQIRINGVVLSATALSAGSLYSFTTPVLPEGTYDVDWLENGVVVAHAYKLFSVTAEVQPTGRVQSLLEPPTEPPGSPSLASDRWLGIGSSGEDGTAARRLPHHNLGSSGQDGVSARRRESHNLGSSGQDGVSPGFRRVPVHNLGSSGEDGVSLRRLEVHNLGSSGQDGVTVELGRYSGPVLNAEPHERRIRVTNLGSSGQDGVEVNLRRLPVHNLGSSGQDGVSVSLMDGGDNGINDWPGGGGVQGFSGEVHNQVVDLAVLGRMLDFVWTRTYRSRTGTNTSMGNHWDFSYNISVAASGPDYLLHNGAGRDDAFSPQTNGTYAAHGHFCEGTVSNTVFKLMFADTGFWLFNPLDGSASAGKISRSQDRNGNAIAFTYDNQGRLSKIVDDLGRTNSVSYDTSSRVQAVTDFSGRSVTYTYYPSGSTNGAPGDLQSVTSPSVTGTPNGNDFPAGKTVTYTYTQGSADDHQNHLLRSITDPKGQTCCVFNYELNPANSNYLRCVSQQQGAETMTCNYEALVPSPSNQFAVMKTFSLDGMGNLSECSYDSRNRCVLQRDYTGRCVPGQRVSDTSNRPTGKLRPCGGGNDVCDPDYFESRWTWTIDSCCAMYVNPRSISRQQFFLGQMDPSVSFRKRGDLCVAWEFACAPVDTDGDGVAETTSRACYYEYDPRFGSPEGRYTKGMIGSSRAINTKGTGSNFRMTGSADIRRKGWDGTIKGRVRGWDGTIKGLYEDCDAAAGLPRKGWDGTIKGYTDASRHCFIVRATDSAGNVDTAAFDAKGNVVIETHPGVSLDGSDSPTRSFAYNGFGQVTTITNAPDANGYRRRDLINYYTSGTGNGYLSDWTVDAQGPTVTICRFEYDSLGRVTRTVDPLGRDMLYVWNSLGQCVRCSSPTNLTARCVVDFSFDADDCLVLRGADLRDENDAKYSTKTDVWNFDASQRCIAFIEQTSATHFITNRFSWDANDNLAAIDSPEAVNGHDPDCRTIYQYDERNLLFREVSAPASGLGGTNEYSYDASGARVKASHIASPQIPGLPTAQYFSYDGFGRCGGAVDAMGNMVTTDFDLNDNLVYSRCDGETNDVNGSSHNIRLSECRFQYDSLDRCVRTTRSYFDPATQAPLTDGFSMTTRAYAPNSACLSITDDNNHSLLMSYDTLGRCASLINARGDHSVCARDACGNVLSRTSIEHSDLGGAEQTFVSSMVYDNWNRCVSESDNVGNTNRYVYDSRDLVVRTTNPRGQLTTRAYDFSGYEILLAGDLDGDGIINPGPDAVIVRGWDDNRRIVSRTDANGHTTTYGYDSLDRCVAITNADLTAMHYTYDFRDNCITNIDENGSRVTLTYDLENRCVRKDIAPGAGVASDTTFEVFAYDAYSRCVGASNNVSVSAFAYDSLGECVRVTQDGLACSQVFDGAGNCLSITYPSARTVSYGYDAIGQVTNVSTSAGKGLPTVTLASYAYDGPGRLSRITRNNTINTRLFWDGLTNPGNSAGDYGWRQVNGINHQHTGGGSVVDRRNTAFDRGQNKIARAQLNPFAAGQDSLTNIWGFDALDRMQVSLQQRSLVSHRTDYTLDKNGNRITVTNDGSAASYVMSSANPPADYQMDQYTSTPWGASTYDDNGNTLSISSPTAVYGYIYDYINRLVEVDDLSGPGGGPIVRFSYDAFGRRVGKTVYPPSPGLPQTIQSVYAADMDCDGIIELRSNGTLIDSCVNLPEDRAHVALISSAGNTRYFHTDETGNTLALSDSGGTVLERYEYADFGDPTFLAADGSPLIGSDGLPAKSSAQGNTFLFEGMVFDGETDLYLSRHLSRKPKYRPTYTAGRFALDFCITSINPKTGRSLSRHTAGTWGGDCSGPTTSAFEVGNPWSAGRKQIANIKWESLAADCGGGACQSGYSYRWSILQAPQGSHAALRVLSQALWGAGEGDAPAMFAKDKNKDKPVEKPITLSGNVTLIK